MSTIRHTTRSNGSYPIVNVLKSTEPTAIALSLCFRQRHLPSIQKAMLEENANKKKKSFGPTVRQRAKRFLHTILAFSNGEIEGGDRLIKKIEINQEPPKTLIVRTKLDDLSYLTELFSLHGTAAYQGKLTPEFFSELGIEPYQGRLTKENVYEVLKRFEDLKLFEDQRTVTRGASIWHFTLHLWHPRYDIQPNLERFEQEWFKHPENRSKSPKTSEGSPSIASPPKPNSKKRKTKSSQDWGQAIDVSHFYGRTPELTILKQWLIPDRCRLISLLGMGGIGKTALSTKLAQDCQDEFDYLIWRSLRNAPPILDLLADLIQFLSNQKATDLPDNLDGRILQLMEHLKQNRCLLILDNVESILSEATANPQSCGGYRPGYEGYGQLLRDICEIQHQSCLILTSREKPRGISLREGQDGPVRSLPLKGLDQPEIQDILKDKGLTLEQEQIQTLVERYGGNPLALQIVATSIQELFAGDIHQFLNQDSAIFGDISELLAQQLNRLSPLEQRVMHWLAIYREWVSPTELQEDLLPATTRMAVLEALSSLQRRSLIENRAGQFTQQPVVMEYVTQRLIEQFTPALLTPPASAPEVVTLGASDTIDWLNAYPLTQAQTQDYLRQAQTKLILQPIATNLVAKLGRPQRAAQWLKQRLQQLKADNAAFPLPGYAAANLLKLMHHLGADLTGLDCSDLSIWQMHLQEMNLHQVNFAHADFRKTVFAQIAKRFMAAVFSPDGQQLATGVDSDIILWDVSSRSPLKTFVGHRSWINGLAFSPDGAILASSSSDETVRLWNLETGQCRKTLRDVGGEVQALVFSPNSDTLASGGEDGTIRFWDSRTGEEMRAIAAHSAGIHSVAFLADGQRLVSSGQDGMVRLWNLETDPSEPNQCKQEIKAAVQGPAACGVNPDGRQLVTASSDKTVSVWDWAEPEGGRSLPEDRQVWSTAFSPDGRYVVTASENCGLRLWDSETGDCVRVMQGHGQRVWLAAFSPVGDLLASCSDDQTLKLWNYQTGQCLSTIKTYSDAVMAVAFSGDGVLASASEDGLIRLWDKETGEVTQTLAGHTDLVGALAFAPGNDRLASGSDDGTVRLWERSTGRCLQVFRGHEGWVQAVAFDPLGRFLASAGQDGMIRFWDGVSGECLQVLEGNGARVKAISFTPDGRFLASGGADNQIRLWDMETHCCVHTLKAHEDQVLSLAFMAGASGWVLASASADRTIRLWSIKPGNSAQVDGLVVSALAVLEGHKGAVRSLAFAAEGRWLVSGGADKRVRVWDVATGACLRVLEGHENVVWSVAWDEETGQVLSGGEDGVMRLWNGESGEVLRVLVPKRPYEGMEITGAMGLSLAQRETLRALGANEVPSTG